MVQIKVVAETYNKAEELIQLIKGSGLAQKVDFEDPDDVNLKPIEVIDFYKKVNAANNSLREQTTLTQGAMEKEVMTW